MTVTVDQLPLSFGYTFGHPFSPFVRGGNEDTPWPYEVSLDGRGFTLDLKHYSWETVHPFRQARDFNAEPGEHSMNPEGAWKRNRDDWTLGTHQPYADIPTSSDRRFNTSLGIDVWTPRQLSLLPDCSLAKSSGSSTQLALSANGYAYLASGTAITMQQGDLHTTTPTADTGTIAGTVVDMTTDGDKVWVATSTAIYSATVGSNTFSLFASVVASFIEYCNGWLLMGNGTGLYSLGAGGGQTLVFTHPSGGFTWNTAVGAPNAIYVAGNASDRSGIYRLGVDNTGALTVPIHAAALTHGEGVLALGYYGGRLLIGSTRGVRIAAIAGDGSAAVGPLLATGPCRGFATYLEDIYFTWDYDTTHRGLGRMRLEEFTASEVPAYASDRMNNDGTGGNVTSVTIHNNKPLWTVASAGHYYEHPWRVASGTIDLGAFTFGVHESKSWSTLEIVTEPLDGRIAATAEHEDGQLVSIGTLQNQGSRNEAAQLSLAGTFGEQLGFRLTLTPLNYALHSPTAGPVVRRLTIRGVPNPLLVEQFMLPIILRTAVEADIGEGFGITRNPYLDLQFLRELESQQRSIQYIEGTTVRSVTVRQLLIPEGMAKGWTENRDAIEGTVMVKLITDLAR